MTRKEKLKTTQISLFLNNDSTKEYKDCLKDKLEYEE